MSFISLPGKEIPNNSLKISVGIKDFFSTEGVEPSFTAVFYPSSLMATLAA